jgi:GDP-L-fucose synthase
MIKKERFDKMENKKILITGGTGFVATNLIKRLLPSNNEITATVHHNSPRIFDAKINYINADLTNRDDCMKVCENQDLVIMCAANTHGAAYMEKNPLALITPNVLMNALMLEAAYSENVKKFIYISSNTVYPVVDYPVQEEEIFNGPVFEKYFGCGWMKRYGEILCEMYSTKIKDPMQTIIIRPANMYGDYDDFEWETSHVVPALIRRVVERHDPLEIWGDGSDLKDLIYIEDFIDGLLLAIEKLESFTSVNIATGKTVSIKEVIQYILELEDYKDANIVFNKDKPTMIPKRVLSTEKAKKVLGFEAKHTMKEGLKKTIEWYKKSLIP